MIVQAVGALFNACWQGLAIVGVTSLALRFFQHSSAATRYAVWFAALMAVVALPAIDFGLARISPAPSSAVTEPAPRFTVVNTGSISYPEATSRTALGKSSVTLPTTTIGFAVEQAPDRVAMIRVLAAGIAGRVGAVLSSVAVPIVLLWLFFSSVMLYRLARAYGRLRSVKRGLVPLENAAIAGLIANSDRPVVVGTATDLAMPCVLGFARPAIALPAKLAAELTRDDLERIVRHEHAHVRRWDDVANALQLVVQAVMCLNPAIHFIGRSLNVEREIACDDFAVEPLAERVKYAKCLTHIAVNGFSRARALPAPGFFFNRKQLLVRVERLLERGHNGSTTIATTARYALAGLALVAIAVARVQLPVIAAPAQPSVPPTSVVPPTFVGGRASLAHFMVGHVGPTSVGGRASLAHFMVGPADDKHRHYRRAHAVQATFVQPISVAIHAVNPVAVATAVRLHSVATVVKLHSVATFVGPTFMVGRPMINIGTTSVRRPMINIDTTSVRRPMINLGTTTVAVADPQATSGQDFLGSLSAAGYKNLSVDELIRLKNVGVDGSLIDAALRYSGFRPSVEMLVRMASVGVDADFLNHLQSSGYPKMTLEDVVRMRAIGVDPSYIRDMTEVLHSRPSIEQLTQMRALGVDADFVRSFAAIGYDKLTPRDLMRLRAMGVDADYVRMLRSKGIGGSGLSVDDLIRMKSVGVE